MLYFNKEFEQGIGGKHHKEQYAHVVNMRKAFNVQQREQAKMYGNAAAIIPQDVYREFENQTKTLMRANNLTMFNDLMPLAKALPIGKIEHVYRQASDSGVVTVSLSGQTPAELDKTAYNYDSSIKVIHQTGFGRQWMEVQGQSTEAFDGLIDDQANAVRKIQDSLVDHFYNGKDVVFNGTPAYGIKTSTKVQAVNLGNVPGGLNIDFTASGTNADAIRAAWVSLIYALRLDNNLAADITFYISAEIEKNFQRIYDSSGGMADKTIMQTLKELVGVADIKTDRSLVGNEVVGMVLSSEYIRPLVGMGIATVPMFRGNPFDNYNFTTWANVGLEIKTDYTGKTGVLYARVIP